MLVQFNGRAITILFFKAHTLWNVNVGANNGFHLNSNLMLYRCIFFRRLMDDKPFFKYFQNSCTKFNIMKYHWLYALIFVPVFLHTPVRTMTIIINNNNTRNVILVNKSKHFIFFFFHSVAIKYFWGLCKQKIIHLIK